MTDKDDSVGHDARGTVAGGLWNAASMVLPIGASFALSVVVARMLGQERLGAQTYISFVTGLVFSFSIPGMMDAAVQTIAQSIGERRADLTRALQVVSFWAHVLGGVIGAAILFGCGLWRGEDTGSWTIVAAVVLVDAFSWWLSARVIAYDGWRSVSQKRIVTQIAAPLIGLGAVLAGGGIQGVFYGQLAASVFLLLWLLGRGARRSPDVPVVSLPLREATQRFAPMALQFTISLVLVQVVQRRAIIIPLEWFRGPNDVALFGVAFQMVLLPLVAVQAIAMAAVPAVAVRNQEGRGEVDTQFRKAIRVLVPFVFVLSSAFVIACSELIHLLYGENFATAALLLPVLGLMVPISALFGMLGALFNGRGHVRDVITANTAGAIAVAAVGLLTVPTLGIWGAAATSIIGQGVALSVLASSRAHPVRRLLPPVGLILRCLVVTALPAAAYYLARQQLDSYAATMGLALGCLALLLAASARSKLLTADDVAWLAGVLPPSAGRPLEALTRFL